LQAKFLAVHYRRWAAFFIGEGKMRKEEIQARIETLDGQTARLPGVFNFEGGLSVTYMVHEDFGGRRTFEVFRTEDDAGPYFSSIINEDGTVKRAFCHGVRVEGPQNLAEAQNVLAFYQWLLSDVFIKQVMADYQRNKAEFDTLFSELNRLCKERDALAEEAAWEADVDQLKKKTYWCVMSEFYDNGTVKAAMASEARNGKPENTCRSMPRMDAYEDWFDSREEAEAFLAEIRKEMAA
jgi:hypothetical protein